LVLGYLIAFILTCVLALLFLIWASPRRYQVKLTRKLGAPPARVWAYVSEPERYPYWFPYVASCKLDGGPASGIGQKRRLQLDRNGVLGEREDEVVTWEEGRRIDLDQKNEMMHGRAVGWRDGRAEYRLEPNGEGTTLTTSYWFYGRGLLGGVFSLLFFRKRHEKDLRLALSHLEKRLREETYTA
jgi:hypothetical protein